MKRERKTNHSEAMNPKIALLDRGGEGGKEGGGGGEEEEKEEEEKEKEEEEEEEEKEEEGRRTRTGLSWLGFHMYIRVYECMSRGKI